MPRTVTEPTIARISRARYDAMIAAGILTENDAIELLDGQIYETMSKGPKHNGHINIAAKLMERRFGDRCIVSCQNSIALHEYSEPEPDIAILRPRADHYTESPAEPREILFLIEVSDSTLAYDRDLKLPLYAAADVAEVWLIDIAATALTVYREPEGNLYRSVITYRRGDTVPLGAFPGESIAVTDLGL
jgi:Uma2 family endonuclease